MESKPINNRLFYGWLVVAATFAITFVGFGFAYTFSAFIGPLQHQFAASRGAISLVFSLAGFLYFGLGAISGPLADRIGHRRLAIIGMAFVALGLLLASQAHNVREIYWAYGLGIGLGIGLAYVPAIGVVQRWFIKRRAFASGLAVSGIGVGTLVMPPLATELIAQFGWRDAYLALGISAAVIGIGMSLFIVSDPRLKNMMPDGEDFDPAVNRMTPPGVSIKEAIRTKQFLSLYISCLVCSFGVFVPFVHLVPYAIGTGVTPNAAAFLLGLIGIGSIGGRFFLGSVADRMGRSKLLVFMYAGMAVSLSIWGFAAHFSGLALFALLFGLFYGGWVAILPAVVTDHFGPRNASGIIGILYTSVAFGTLLGPSCAGFIFDLRHSYMLPIILSVFSSIIAAAVSVTTSRNSVSEPAEEHC